VLLKFRDRGVIASSEKGLEGRGIRGGAFYI